MRSEILLEIGLILDNNWENIIGVSGNLDLALIKTFLTFYTALNVSYFGKKITQTNTKSKVKFTGEISNKKV